MYPLAHVFDAYGSEVSGSPFVLSHLNYGLYIYMGLIMPMTPELKAVYKVFSDAGHTVPSKCHSDAIDIFPLEEKEDTLVTNLIGTIETDSTLVGVADGLIDLGGNAFGDILLTGSLEIDNLKGTVEEGFLTGTINEEDTTGEVKC